MTTVQKLVCFGICVSLLVVVIILVCGFYKWKNQTRYEECQVTKEKFLIQNNKDESQNIGQQVATIIALHARKADYIVLYMYNEKLPNKIISERLYKNWNKIRKNPNGIREVSKNDNSAAYTINKNEVRLCVRTEDNKFEDLNTGFFVLLHELAHIMSKHYGHGLEFEKNFAFITQLAIDLGLYKYTDYSQFPETYCNVDITTHPITSV